MSVKVFGINLDRNPDRLEVFDNQLSALNIDYERISAVDGKELSEDFVANFRRNSYRPTGWMLGQIGCFLSHYSIWQKMVEIDIPVALILEDDIVVSDDLVRFIDNIDWLPPESDIIRVENTTNWIKKGKCYPLLGREVCKIENDSWCAGGYILSLETAKMLVSLDKTYWLPADTLLFAKSLSPVAKELNIFSVSPSLVAQTSNIFDNDVVRFKSNIEMNKSLKPKLNLLHALKAVVAPFLGYPRIKFKK